MNAETKKKTKTSYGLPAEMTVLEARDAYLAENGFDLAGYDAPTFDVEAFGRVYTFKNPPLRRRAIPLHDLHHAATGYGTDLVGEAEIGAFELTAGCRTWVVYFLNVIAFTTGLFLAPRRVLRALRDARGSRTLYRTPIAYDAALAMTLGELRGRLGLPAAGLARERPRLHERKTNAARA